MSASDSVNVSLDVNVDPATAFEIFTNEIDRWWQTGPKYRFRAPWAGVMRIEPGVGGRLVQMSDQGGELFEAGRILVWEPPKRIVFEWRLPNFTPDQVTEVEVRFEPIDGGTCVAVQHRGWDSLPAGHPAKHGLAGHAFVMLRGEWWASQLGAMRDLAEGSAAARQAEE